MERQLIIEDYPWETRIAVMEDSRLVELLSEEGDDRVGNIYKARVKDILPGLSCAFVDLGSQKNAFLYQGDLAGRTTDIRDVLSRNQELLVQVKKEEVPGKGARVTTNITLPGHYLVLLPGGSEVSISRKIQNSEVKEELRSYIKEIKPDGFGLILRTAGALATAGDLEEEIEELMGLWQEINSLQKETSAPALVYRDLDIVQRVLRDYIDGFTTSITVNSEERADFIRTILAEDPAARGTKIYTNAFPFEEMGIEKEIMRIIKPRIWLKSGGFLVIEETEAMTVIDVNSGRYTGKTELKDTVLKTNLEAAVEIPRQLRLRAIGGIILIDFIDMKDKNDGEEVIRVLQENLAGDKSRTRVMGLTRLGLVEMTRKKSRASMANMMCRQCLDCGGRGLILDSKHITNGLLRALNGLAHRIEPVINVEVTPDLMDHLHENRYLIDLRNRLGKEINLISNPDLDEHYRILP
ncbi:MAG: Rne/Rng family ribonuclease [Chitinophagales bacterium]